VNPHLFVAVPDLTRQAENAAKIDVSLDGRLDSVSFTPRAAAMLPMPDVMHAAMACSRNSTGVGA
jgi:hypothetical protein